MTTENDRLAVLKIINTIAYIGMIIVNILAEALPINGVSTGEVANAYPNLFTPSPLTFSIWGLIYLLLAGFVLYQLGVFSLKNQTYRADVIKDIGLWFAASCLANTAWIFAWHYKRIALSVVFMLLLLVTLIVIVGKIQKQELSLKEKFFIKLPFSIYFAWITIATIANITVLLVSLDFSGWGISRQAWTVAVMLLGLLIGLIVMIKNKDVAYGLVMVWAYAGILIRHISNNGFNGVYPSVIITAVACIVLFAVVAAVLFANQTKPAKRGGTAH